jgi:hypothetical protein
MVSGFSIEERDPPAGCHQNPFMRKWPMDGIIPKSMRDALLIIHFDIERSVSKKDVDALLFNGMIVAKHPTGWMTTSIGRNYIRKLKKIIGV